MTTIILASNNKDKVKVVKEILKEYNIISLKDAGIDLDVEENGTTFEENALIKARGQILAGGATHARLCVERPFGKTCRNSRFIAFALLTISQKRNATPRPNGRGVFCTYFHGEN